jgi:hypothetical protein
MVYILDEIVTKLILLPKYQQFSLKPEPQIGKNFPLRMMYTLGRKPQDWRIGSVPQVYKKKRQRIWWLLYARMPTAPVIR